MKKVKNLVTVVVVAGLALCNMACAKEYQDTASYYSKGQLSQTFDACQNLFIDGNSSKIEQAFQPNWNKAYLCSNDFAVVYSKVTKTPLVVVEKLNAKSIADAKGEKRTNNFYPDPRLKAEDSASLADYKNTKESAISYDRGHNAPAGDATDEIAMNQSFALSNMVPQVSYHNQNPWRKIESDVRKYASRTYSDVFVFTGPLFAYGTNKPATKGKGKVWIPTHMYKVIYTPATKKSFAYISEVTDTSVPKPISYEDFRSITGITLY